MRREKRTVFIKGRITPSLSEQLELELDTGVISLSTYLFQLVTRDLAARKAAFGMIRTRKTKARA
jgi:hypothetical protein